MEVAYSFLARAGEFTPDGTFSAIGADFSVIHGTAFPVVLPAATLIAKLVFMKEEWGKHHEVKIEVIGDDKVNLAPEMKQEFDVPVPQDPEKKIAMRLAVVINGLQFPRPGYYQARLLLDGQEVHSIKLEVVEITAPG